MKKTQPYWLAPGYKCCTSCGKRYFRSNRLRIWTVRAPGKRIGWVKEDVKLCNACMDTQTMSKVLDLVRLDGIGT